MAVLEVPRMSKFCAMASTRENDIGCPFYGTSLVYEPLLGGELVLGLATLKELGLQEREG